MALETDSLVKYGGVGLILGAVITIIVGFAWGGWLTRVSSEEMIDAALLSTRAAICVAQFTKDPDYETKLKEFEGKKFFERRKFIEQGGWDKMPGEDKASFTVTRACTDGLGVLMEK